MIRPTALALIAILGPALAPLPAAAQSPFAPAARVDGGVVTNYEVGQRQRMLELFNSPDASAEAARDDLIDERLQMAEARRLEIEVTPEDLAAGKAEFAARADLDTQAFVARLREAGVAEQSFDDFVRAGLAWRAVVAQRFGGGQTQVAPDQVERAADAPPQPDLRVLINEIIIPADTPDRAARAQALAPEIAAIRDFGSFAAAARQYSATPSRERGGALDWLTLDDLPPRIARVLRGLSPGEVTPPIPLPNALAFFQLREIGELPDRTAPTALEYAALYLPGGRSPEALSRAAGIAAQADTCDDLYGVGAGDQLQRDTLPLAQIPEDVRLELAKLDPGEVSTALTRSEGRTLVMLMLCDRSYRAPDAEAPDLDAIRTSLVNRRVSQKAENLLAELRANAAIRIE